MNTICKAIIMCMATLLFASCAREERTVEYLSPDYAGNAVDLGLSVKWADRNVGAADVSDAGYYFGFGELDPCTASHKDTYRFQVPRSASIAGNPTADAAACYWEGNWRMPTYEQFLELCRECTWTAEYQPNGQQGVRVTGPNGNSIFLPAAGIAGTRTGQAVYWTASTTSGGYPYYFNLIPGNYYIDSYSPWSGRLLRPVCPE